MTGLLARPGNDTRTVRAGTASGSVVRCGATDTLLQGMAPSLVLLFERAVRPDRLERGLVAALRQVPLFGGRLRAGPTGMPEVVCDDTGIPLTFADSADSLAEAASRMTLPTAGYVDVVQAGPQRPADAPLATARVTRLAGGAMAVGCSWHHALGDLQSFMLLVHAWSAAVDDRPMPEVVLAEDREAQLDAVLPAAGSGRSGYRLPAAEEAAELARELRAGPRTNRVVQVYFGTAEVDRMRAAYGAEAGRRLSANDVVLGHLIGTVRRLDGDTESRRLALPVNFRRHLGLHPHTVGNLVSEMQLDVPGGARPAELAAQVRDGIEHFTERHLSVRANREFLAGVGPDRAFDTMPVGFEPAARTFFLTNWCRTGVYDVTFGGRPPVWFGPEVPLPTAWSSWLCEGFGGAGYLVTVVVPARLAGRLRNDPGLHAYREPGDVLPPLAAEIRKLA